MKYILLLMLLISTTVCAEPSEKMTFDTSKQACTQLFQSLATNIGVEGFCKLESKLSNKIKFMYKKVCNQILTEAEIKQSADIVMSKLTETHQQMGEDKFCKQYVLEYDILLRMASQPAEPK
ncbi:MAG: hypothetical protein KAG06_07280 [Methylococcales bacterium]|nr:hypothetical protein [Methylococcales bacterium]